MAKRKSSTLLENVKTIIYAGLIAIGIRTFLFEPFNIPSGIKPSPGDACDVSRSIFGPLGVAIT
jgi:hypothetical protein